MTCICLQQLLCDRCTAKGNASYPCNAPVVNGQCCGSNKHECKEPKRVLKVTCAMYSPTDPDIITSVDSTVASNQFLPLHHAWNVRDTKKKIKT